MASIQRVSLIALALPLFLLENFLRLLQVCNAANCPVLAAFMMTNSFRCCKKENPSLVCYSYVQSIVKEHNEIPISVFMLANSTASTRSLLSGTMERAYFENSSSLFWNLASRVTTSADYPTPLSASVFKRSIRSLG
ncbi:hypothetical protein BGZ57DRAFT_552450 [Hyaloscypha finlandica]|nr:hypothetical protein BGZ57DRAFT_552450 [Hyaloscypha finlandica]